MARTPARNTPSSPKAGAARNQLRIIAGEWRSRKLTFPDVPGLRPTTDRVRETLFNWLSSWVPGSRCLDAFSGSGALGFEALSRGAEWATFIDNAQVVTRQLQANLTLLNCRQAEVQQAQTQDWLQQPASRQFDLVFLDPPFQRQLLEPAAQALEQQGWLADTAMIYVEHEQELQPQLPASWQLHRQKQAGQVIYSLYHRQTGGSDSPTL
ncbi:hypothetical protein WH50_08885 [Pokkaliibacter plantistimulans]|uniref:Ribosomal RNA small subunit methyltransferase D n=1 Tax=Pokkaliibacter plantistimulans TaxID=1635171 RepID=A0ABX5LY66_9GAMM|nr:16S rRNA (guanine(966)-N(2))-methyltransferase RsmD [Pokkaliibacter plantistimulans]PXF31615.1 hypothetical protein WH50_08885 [Pokkaliibacter plantistimulans]